MVDSPTVVLPSLLDRLRQVRRDLHQHPELGFEEHRTQGIVIDWLREHGYQPRACAGTGVIADLREAPAPTIALRADLDCLPMPEHTDLPWRSVHDGRAHKCGHDGHTAILLGVAAVLAAQPERTRANVRLLFQPAEEGVRGGGARVMVAEGALAGVAECYGLHNWPGFPKGEVRVAAGPLMAQVDNFEIVVEGVGGHASEPQRCRDPVLAGASVLQAVQGVVARGVGSRGVAVVSVTQFHAGTADNVIPREARMRGTIRTFDPALRGDLIERLHAATAGAAAAHGCNGKFELLPEYPVLVNDAACAERVRDVAMRVVGADCVSGEGLPICGAEDFAYFAQAVPSAYFFLGAGAPVGGTPGCHHPDFDFDEDLLELGVRMFIELVQS
ncbi:MAG: M20 family metallopeptidase [Planctomycetota bacterium]